jgi:hypothetical protein
VSAVRDLVRDYQHVIADLTLVMGSKGVFDVTVDGELLFSKHAKRSQNGNSKTPKNKETEERTSGTQRAASTGKVAAAEPGCVEQPGYRPTRTTGGGVCRPTRAHSPTRRSAGAMYFLFISGRSRGVSTHKCIQKKPTKIKTIVAP